MARRQDDRPPEDDRDATGDPPSTGRGAENPRSCFRPERFAGGRERAGPDVDVEERAGRQVVTLAPGPGRQLGRVGQTSLRGPAANHGQPFIEP